MELKKATRKKALQGDDGWMPVSGIGYKNLYELHWRGFVRNSATKEILRGSKTSAGYYTEQTSQEMGGSVYPAGDCNSLFSF